MNNKSQKDFNEELQTDSIHEKLNKIDLDLMEKELKELVVQIEATNAKIKKTRVVTHETLRLVINL
jgi:hypothetical protein